MSDVLHHTRPTETQQAIINHQARFRANIAAQARKIVIVCNEPEAVPVPVKSTNDLAFGPIVHPAKPVKPPATVRDIIRATCRYFGISRVEFISVRRHRYLVRPRQVAMYLCITLTSRTLPFIGSQMGGRDHTTVMHGGRAVQGLILAGDQYIINAIDTLTSEFA